MGNSNNKIITEELKQIVVLMNYDRSKTLSEQMGHKAYMGPNHNLYQGDPDGFVKDSQTWHDNNVAMMDDLVGDIDHHYISGIVEITLVMAGIAVSMTGVGLVSGVGPALILAGTAVGVADALVYFAEGDAYMGTMMLALNLIPGGELVGMLTKKAAAETAEVITEQTIKQARSGMGKLGKEILTDVEQAALDQVSKAMKKITPEIIAKNAKYALEAMQKTLKSIPLSKTIALLMKLSGKVGKTVIKVGRVAITVDLFWTLYTTPESWRRKMRDKGSFSKIMDMLYDGKLDDTIIDGLWGLWNKLWNEDGTENIEGREEFQKILVDNNISDEELTNTEYSKNITELLNTDWEKSLNDLDSQWSVNSETIKSQKSNYEPVKFDNLIKGKQTIRKGQKGDVVRDIQRMLVTLGYYLGNTGKTKDGVDGDYGDKMETALYKFQIDNDLDDFDGIVGKDTSNKLYELYKEKKGL